MEQYFNGINIDFLFRGNRLFNRMMNKEKYVYIGGVINKKFVSVFIVQCWKCF